MSIPFAGVPTTLRVPFVAVEFDNSKAQTGPSIQEYNVLLVGQKLAAGSQAELTRVQSQNESEIKSLFGAGSHLHRMAKKYLQNNLVTALHMIAIDDLGAGVAASGSILFGGTSIEAGTLAVMIGGDNYQVGVAEGDTPETVVTNLIAEITADDESYVTAAVNGGDAKQIDITAKNKGTLGNGIDIRLNYFSGEKLPVNLTAAITPMAGGSGDPDFDEIIGVLPDEQFNIIGFPWNDAANLGKIEGELVSRFGPLNPIDGVAFTAKNDTFSNLGSLGNSRNSPHDSIIGSRGPTFSVEWIGAVCGQVAEKGQIDPARPFQTLQLLGILGPDDSEKFTLTERNLLLSDGISTFTTDAGGNVRIERMITTFKTNAFGSPDTSYLDVNTLLTLSFLRFDFRAQVSNSFPRSKLAGDGNKFGAGQPIVTPLSAKAKAVAIARGWETLGLVEDIATFKEQIIVERNVQDVNRLDFLLPPDLVNQARVFAALVQFKL